MDSPTPLRVRGIHLFCFLPLRTVQYPASESDGSLGVKQLPWGLLQGKPGSLSAFQEEEGCVLGCQ